MLTLADLKEKISDAVSGELSMDEFMEWVWENFTAYERGELRFEKKNRGRIFEALTRLTELDSASSLEKENLEEFLDL